MNEKHEFQVGDLVRLKSVEEILALGFWFDELGGISYPNKKEIMLLSNELQYCGKEYVVKDVVDITAHNHITLDSPNSSVRIVNICPGVLELVEVEEDEFEDWISKPDLKVKPGDKVRIKTHEELIETGWTFDGDNYFHSIDDEAIVKSMHKFLGGVYAVEEVEDEVITLEEDEDYWNWTFYMIAEVVEENTYRDEEGNPFDPISDYIEEEDYRPYCAVVDKIKNNPSEWVTYKPTETIWEEQSKSTTWDKERIQRGFENLEMYHKGYADGFQQVMKLMKKEFGVE